MKMKESLKRKFPRLQFTFVPDDELTAFYVDLNHYNRHKAKAKRIRQIARASRKRNRLCA